MNKNKESTPKVIKKSKVNPKGGIHVTSGHIITGMGYSSGTYYPAGSALLKEEERTYANYRTLFEDEIEPMELSTIDGLSNKANAKSHFDEKFKKLVSLITKHSILEKIMLTAIIIMIFSLPLAIFVEDSITNAGFTTINYSRLGFYYLILTIIVLITYNRAKHLAYEIKQSELALDFTKMKSDTFRIR